LTGAEGNEARTGDSEVDTDKSDADSRMAEILAGHRAPATVRRQLRTDDSAVAGDLLERLNALEFVDSIVGGAGDLPERLGDYRIVGLLGRGGMGTVFEAYQESLDRHVALKVLSPAFSTDVRMRQRFRAEAKATAALHHQHIVPIYGYGEAAGVLYFAMEKVDGVSLDKHIATARHRGAPLMTPEEAARKFSGVADALAHAHRRRLLHRDVKPGNLLVNPDGTLSLADFGLSKVLGEASMNVTAGGAFLGTLHYAPPEQAKGQALTPASDLYSLGVTIFEALTNELPLRGDSTEAMLQELLHGTPRRLRALVPNAPKDLAAVIDKLLQKSPEDRYEDAEELARDLRRVAEGEPVRIRRQPLIARIWRRIKRRPGQAAAVLAVTVLVGVTVWLTIANWRVRRDRATTQAENLRKTAMAAVMWEAGEAKGPGGLLEALTGSTLEAASAEVARPSPTSALQRHLDEASKLVPDDLRTEDLREAYADDPLPAASEDLEAGRGRAAKERLDAEIADKRRAQLDEESDKAWLRLYRLYLARAVASLTAAVARPDDARLDLVRASMVRPGAFFPRLLQTFVDWQPERGAAPLVAALEGLLDEHRDVLPDARLAAGSLGQAVAGLERGFAAQLMRFEMPYRTRLELHAWSQQQLAGHRVRGLMMPEPWTGFGGQVALLGRAALQELRDAQDPATVQRHIDDGRAWLAHVAADAPLQRWSLVFDVLESGRFNQDLPLDVRIRGWIELLGLDPAVSFVRERIAEPVRELLSQHPDAPGVHELAARLEFALGSFEEALRWSGLWYQQDTSDPEPLLSRFAAEVRLGRAEAAAFSMALVLQKAFPGHSYYRERMNALLRPRLERGATEREKWMELRRALRR
jgi:hypothetical protein